MSNIYIYKKVWEEFEFNTFQDFHNQYLKKEILLLVDTFEKFISTYLKYYGLHLYHYFRAPGLSWDAMLKMTNRIKNISDTRNE